MSDDPVVIGVVTCAGCPLLDPNSSSCSVGSEYQTLRHLSFDPMTSHRPPPDWCPLRRADHLVTLRKP